MCTCYPGIRFATSRLRLLVPAVKLIPGVAVVIGDRSGRKPSLQQPAADSIVVDFRRGLANVYPAVPA